MNFNVIFSKCFLKSVHKIQMRFHKVFDHIVAYNQQRNEAINNDLIFSNLSFLGKTSFDDLYKLPHRSKITQMVDVMGLKIDEIMGYNGLATKKTHHSQAFGSLLSVNAQRVFDSFLGGKTTNIRLKNCLIVSSFQLYNSVSRSR